MLYISPNGVNCLRELLIIQFRVPLVLFSVHFEEKKTLVCLILGLFSSVWTKSASRAGEKDEAMPPNSAGFGITRFQSETDLVGTALDYESNY